jgi:hypothetical protein
MTRRILSAATAVLAAAALNSCHRATKSNPIPPSPRAAPLPRKTEPRKRTPAPVTIPPAETPRTPPPARSSEAPAPSLGEMVTNADREETSRHIDAALDRARKNLAVLANHSLTAEQTKNVERVGILSRQAREARAANDLVTARNLADRAEVLSQDLLKSVK